MHKTGKIARKGTVSTTFNLRSKTQKKETITLVFSFCSKTRKRMAFTGWSWGEERRKSSQSSKRFFLFFVHSLFLWPLSHLRATHAHDEKERGAASRKESRALAALISSALTLKTIYTFLFLSFLFHLLSSVFFSFFSSLSLSSDISSFSFSPSFLSLGKRLIRKKRKRKINFSDKKKIWAP